MNQRKLDQEEFEGSQDQAGQGVVALPSAAIMESVRDVAGRTMAHVKESPYRTTGFVPGQVETVDCVPGTNVDQEMGFPVHTIIADNPSKLWVYVVAAKRFVGPGVIGKVMQVPQAATKLELKWRAPGGITQPGAGASTQATFTCCEAWFMPSAGEIPVVGGS
jgi:hypothetical protein